MNLKIFGICSAVMLLYGGNVFARDEVDESPLDVKSAREFWQERDGSLIKPSSKLKNQREVNFEPADSQETLVEDEEINSQISQEESNLKSKFNTFTDFTGVCETITSDFDKLKEESVFLKKRVEELNTVKSPEKQAKQVPVLKEKVEDHKNKIDKMISDLNKLQTWLEEFNINKKVDELNSRKSAIDTIRQEIARKQLALWENKIKSYRKSLSQFWNILQNYKVSKDKISSGAKKCFGEASNSSKLFDLNSFDSQMFDISGINIKKETKKNIANDWEEICNNLYPNAEEVYSEIMKLHPNDQKYNNLLNDLRSAVEAFHDKVQSLLGKYTDKGERTDVRGVTPHDIQKKRQNLKKAETNSSKRALKEGLKRQRSRMTGGGE